MVLVDTSIWVEHFRQGNKELSGLLTQIKAITHPFVIGELACGNLKNRKEILSLFSELPQAVIAEHDEVLLLVENKGLMGHGIGWIDAHLLASALLTGVPLWTKDKRLKSLAAVLNILY